MLYEHFAPLLGCCTFAGLFDINDKQGNNVLMGK